jgi:DNA-directed RNA polymerase subunit beta
MGDFPLMTDKGTFVINGTERVVVSQLVRSPGVYFERTADKTSDKDIFTAKIIPSRGAVARVRDRQARHGRRALDRKRKQTSPCCSRPSGATDAQILEEFGQYESMRHPEKDHTSRPGRRAARHLPQAAPGEPPTREAAQALENLTSTPSATTCQGRPVQDQQESWARSFDSVLTVDDIVDRSVHRRLHDGTRPLDARRRACASRTTSHHFGNGACGRSGELIQNQRPHRTGPAWSASVRERMTTQDVEAITPQT